MTAPANVDRPGSWTKYRNGLCDNCWAGCCTMPVEVRVSDLVRLELASEDEAEHPKRVFAKLKKEGFVRSYRAATGLFQLERRPAGDCVFLGADRLCTVYEKRPEVCRKFPQIGVRPGYCPAGKKS